MEEAKEIVRFKTIIEVLGSPKEHVEKAIKSYIEKIKADSDLSVLKDDYAPAKEQDNMWSTFVEMELVVKGAEKLITFCFDYMPSSIEIIKPEEIKFNNVEMSNFFNDLQARLHNVDMVAKRLHSENTFLKRNLNMSFKNTISILLTIKEKLKLDELSKLTGINEKELQGFLDSMLKEDKIKKENDFYILKR